MGESRDSMRWPKDASGRQAAAVIAQCHCHGDNSLSSRYWAAVRLRPGFGCRPARRYMYGIAGWLKGREKDKGGVAAASAPGHWVAHLSCQCTANVVAVPADAGDDGDEMARRLRFITTVVSVF